VIEVLYWGGPQHGDRIVIPNEWPPPALFVHVEAPDGVEKAIYAMAPLVDTPGAITYVYAGIT
jgi:hypothetical protein